MSGTASAALGALAIRGGMNEPFTGCFTRFTGLAAVREGFARADVFVGAVVDVDPLGDDDDVLERDVEERVELVVVPELGLLEDETVGVAAVVGFATAVVGFLVVTVGVGSG